VLDEEGAVVDTALLSTDESIEAWTLGRADGQGCVVAVTSPLVVPNEEGERPWEAELHFAGVPTYPSSRALLEETLGCIRGERLAARLAEHGFRLQSAPEPGGASRILIEVYPQATNRRLFGRPPTYKGSKASGGVLAHGLRVMQALVLEQLDPPIRWERPPVPSGAAEAIPGRLKDAASLLDAALAAYVGLLAWLPGPARVETLGAVREGFVVLPLSRPRPSRRVGEERIGGSRRRDV
jgi:predicted RNase H-like nuclease